MQMVGQVAPAGRPQGTRCAAPCSYDTRARQHHDRLLGVDRDPACMLELLEFALTWNELDYEPDSYIRPESWDDFVTSHRWRDAAQALRVFSLASDIVMRCRADRRALDASTPVASVYAALTGRSASDVL